MSSPRAEGKLNLGRGAAHTHCSLQPPATNPFSSPQTWFPVREGSSCDSFGWTTSGCGEPGAGQAVQAAMHDGRWKRAQAGCGATLCKLPGGGPGGNTRSLAADTALPPRLGGGHSQGRGTRHRGDRAASPQPADAPPLGCPGKQCGGRGGIDIKVRAGSQMDVDQALDRAERIQGHFPQVAHLVHVCAGVLAVAVCSACAGFPCWKSIMVPFPAVLNKSEL